MDTTLNDKPTWKLKRNCSFSPKQLGLFYLAQSAFALSVAFFFYLRGAWIVPIFTAIELTVLAIALLIYARHTTDYECIQFSEGTLIIRISSLGSVTEHRCNPLWVRIGKELNKRQLITVSYQKHEWQLGQYLRVEQRLNLLNELRHALRHYS